MIYGYINPTQTQERDAQHIAAIMHRLGCKTILEEEKADNEERPVWFFIMKEIQQGDTLAIPKLCLSLEGIHELPMFLDLCRCKQIRLISIMDNIDTDGMIYETSPLDYFCMITSFLKTDDEEDGSNGKGKKKRYNGKPLRSIEKLMMKRQKELRDCEVVNMYSSGYSIAKIMEFCGFKTKRAVFYILHKNGINTDRCHPRPQED